MRFFTVYGPWGRPDMSLFIFTKSIFENIDINLFNNGDMVRDFTYVDDVVESIIRLINIDQEEEKIERYHEIFNIGSGNPIKLLDYKVNRKTNWKKLKLNTNLCKKVILR